MRERRQQGSSKQDKKANERIESERKQNERVIEICQQGSQASKKKKQMKGDKTKEREKYVSNEEQASDIKKK